jgi:hypothetical protein
MQTISSGNNFFKSTLPDKIAPTRSGLYFLAIVSAGLKYQINPPIAKNANSDIPAQTRIRMSDFMARPIIDRGSWYFRGLVCRSIAAHR